LSVSVAWPPNRTPVGDEPTCTRLPWSADNGALPGLLSVAAFPLAGPHRALGLASNVFRRSAAHSFGLHATPAVGSRRGRRGFQQSRAHRSGHPLPAPKCGVDRVSQTHRCSTVISIGAPIPLHQNSDTLKVNDERTGGSWGLSPTSASFSVQPPQGSRWTAISSSVAWVPTTSQAPDINSWPVSSRSYLRTTNPRRYGKSFGPCLNDEGETVCHGGSPWRPCNLFPHSPVGAADIQTSWMLCSSAWCARSQARSHVWPHGDGCLEERHAHTHFPRCGRAGDWRVNRVLGCRPDSHSAQNGRLGKLPCWTFPLAGPE